MDQTSKTVQKHKWNILEIHHLIFLFLKVRNLNQISLLLGIPANEVDDMIEQLNLFEIFAWEPFSKENPYFFEESAYEEGKNLEDLSECDLYACCMRFLKARLQEKCRESMVCVNFFEL